jgi:tripartite-type tricarboxylate transporter receptor subunit TctC
MLRIGSIIRKPSRGTFDARPTLPRRVIPALTVLLVALSGHNAWSQTAKTIKIIVPFPPGGPTDTVARLLAEQIGRVQGPTMLIENRPGAGSVIGTEAAARAAPDGNTLLVTAPAFVINPHLRQLNYDPLTSLEPICYLVNSPPVIVVNFTSPYRTLTDLLNTARAKPGELTLASVGPATGTQLAFEMLKRAANIDMTFVPYPGTAPTITALLGDHVTSALVNYSDAAEQLKAAKLRGLAVATSERIEPLPNVPTVAEFGYRDYDAGQEFGIVTPAKTSKEMVTQLIGLFAAALQAPEMKAKLVGQGLFPVGVCGAEFAARLRKQYDDYGRVIRGANMKAVATGLGRAANAGDAAPK